MLFLIYKTTNKINGKFYIGCHRTNDIKDNYLGSGTIIKKAIEKYGKHNFHKEILIFCDNAEEMFQIESKIVNEEFIERNDNYNVAVGGHGGFDFIHANMTIEKTERRIKNFKKTMNSNGKEEARRRKLADAWKSKTEEEIESHKKKVKKAVSSRDEKQRIKNFKTSMESKSDEEKKLRLKRIEEKNAKVWEIKSPSGEIFLVKGLPKFCKEHELNLSAMYNSAAGVNQKKNPGWSCRRIYSSPSSN